jgi:protein involved in polysaccharide export with SLBB domain
MRMVRVEGEVAVPGVYSMAVGDTVRDAISRAGGPTDEAYLYGTVLSRPSARRQEAERLKQVVDQAEQDYDRFLATRSRDIVSQEDALVSGSETGNARALIAKLREVQPIGRVVFTLDGEIDDASGLPALPLEDGDVLLIPRRSPTVTVAGAVFQQGTQVWRAGADAADYLRNAGGTRPYADRSQIVVFHADGSVRPLRRGLGGGADIHPGDSILVPEDVDRTTLGRRLREWTTILYQMALGAAALKVIRN